MRQDVEVDPAGRRRPDHADRHAHRPDGLLGARAGTAKLEHWKEDYEGRSLHVRLSPLFDPFLTERYKDAVKHANEFRLIRSRFDIDKWIDRSFLNASLKELKLENYWPASQAGVPR